MSEKAGTNVEKACTNDIEEVVNTPTVWTRVVWTRVIIIPSIIIIVIMMVKEVWIPGPSCWCNMQGIGLPSMRHILSPVCHGGAKFSSISRWF